MNLQVAGAYPYAGCVFYVGATNIGDGVVTIELGSLTADATVACTGLGCQASDIEMVAGGPNQEVIDALCRFEGAVEPAGGPLLFQLAPEATVICPLFIALLQPAAEDASYRISVIPPPPEASNANP